MLNGTLKTMPTMPRRVVLELRADEYQALEQLGRGPYRSLTPAHVIQLVAVQLARER